MGMKAEEIYGQLTQLKGKVKELKNLSPFSYKGSVANKAALPTTAKKGDVYTTADDGNEYVYDGSSWILLGADISSLKAQVETNTEDIETNTEDIDSLQGEYNVYEGVDLTVKFASEIANYDNEWAWMQARVKAANFAGLRIHDYIPVTCSNGKVLREEIAGIDTYYGNAPTQIGHHIDFISKECWDETVKWNLVNINNGTADNHVPFMASNVKKFLMSEAGAVPNSTTDMTVTTDVDYTKGGVWYFLPDKLKNVIVEKNVFGVIRYTEGSIRTSDNFSWSDYNYKLPKLWLPDEVEVYGRTVFEGNGSSYGWFHKHYPCFIGNSWFKGRVGALTSRADWWLLSPYSGNSTNCCYVYYFGFASNNIASYALRVPVCFRIA